MDYNNDDIIIARATPVGKSALAIIRISGNSLSNIIASTFHNKIFKPNIMGLQDIQVGGTGDIIDSCMVVYYKNPKSFTGEDMLEIFCHGNDRIVENIIKEFIQLNVRIAYPGEFSYRAFKNGKIDLLQAESIASKINQNSDQYGVALQNLEKGITSKKISSLRKDILNIRSIIEHELDFNEEEITHLGITDIKQKFNSIITEIELILNWSLYLQKIEQGYKVVFLGAPNVGKSTLFNRIVGQDRAIVTEIKGTTRDVLENQIYIKGLPFVFYDTAGYRDTQDTIEKIGVNKTKEMIEKADVVLLLDEHSPNTQYEVLLKENPLLNEKQIIFVKTKCDAGVKMTTEGIIEISCDKDLGVDVLLTRLYTMCGENIEKESASNIALCNMRQIRLLNQIKSVFVESLACLEVSTEMDLIASQLKGASDAFDELLGKMAPNEVLNNIFKGFCVGK